VSVLERARAYWLKHQLAVITNMGAPINEEFEQQVLDGKWDGSNDVKLCLSIVQAECERARVLADVMHDILFSGASMPLHLAKRANKALAEWEAGE
jgi:hypothetical protein